MKNSRFSFTEEQAKELGNSMIDNYSELTKNHKEIYLLTRERAERISSNTIKVLKNRKISQEESETIYCNPFVIGCLALQKNSESTPITGNTKEEIRKELKDIFEDSKILHEKVNITKEQTNQIGLDTLKRYAENIDQPFTYLEL